MFFETDRKLRDCVPFLEIHSQKNTQTEFRNAAHLTGICFGKTRYTLVENLVTGLKNCFVKISSQGTLMEAWESL
jgi:hypothetical protein